MLSCISQLKLYVLIGLGKPRARETWNCDWREPREAWEGKLTLRICGDLEDNLCIVQETMYTVTAKGATLFLPLTLPNADRF